MKTIDLIAWLTLLVTIYFASEPNLIGTDSWTFDSEYERIDDTTLVVYCKFEIDIINKALKPGFIKHAAIYSKASYNLLGVIPDVTKITIGPFGKKRVLVDFEAELSHFRAANKTGDLNDEISLVLFDNNGYAIKFQSEKLDKDTIGIYRALINLRARD